MERKCLVLRVSPRLKRQIAEPPGAVGHIISDNYRRLVCSGFDVLIVEAGVEKYCRAAEMTTPVGCGVSKIAFDARDKAGYYEA